MLNKRGVVSIATFSLIILISLIILGFSYDYYTDSIYETSVIMKKDELKQSLGSFRAELINLVAYSNANLSYSSNLDSNDIEIDLGNSSIGAKIIFNGNYIKENISNLGIEFCNSYTFSPADTTMFYYNGSCVSILN